MKLIKLTINSFQGIKSFEFVPNGNDASIYGTNGSGKTTIYNSMTWLLFDKASTGEKGFSPKTKGKDGSDIHNMNNRVEGTFELEDGTIINFTKDLHEKWTKKRGCNTEELTGNETEYCIDGVPVNKSEYDQRLAHICSAEMAQILTQPEYFPESMSWQNRRKLLLEVCGDVTEYDVINSNEDLREITSFLLKPGTNGQFYSVDDYQKIAAVRRKDINTKLDQMPARIDEAAKAMPDITGIDEATVNATINKLQSDKAAIREELSSLSATSTEQSIRRQIAEINTQISEGKAKFNENKNASLSSERARIAEIQADKQKLSYQVQALKSTIDHDASELSRIKQEREKLSAEYKSLKESVWSGDTVCRYCGQALPADNIEEAKANFNLHKSSELERIRTKTESECSKVIISDLESEIESDTQTEKALSDKIKGFETEIEFAKEKIKPAESEAYESTAEYARYASQIADLKKTDADSSVNASDNKNALQAKIEALDKLIGNEQQKLLLLKSCTQQQNRISELEAEEKKLNAEFEKLNQGLYLCELFIKTKVSMLNDKINSKFTSVKFRLFETQINGGIKEDCEVMIPTPNGLVPFSSANNAARINAGLEIIDTLSEHWGVTMPVFVDNAESVVQLKPIASQVIRLVVSEVDDKLRMEVG